VLTIFSDNIYYACPFIQAFYFSIDVGKTNIVGLLSNSEHFGTYIMWRCIGTLLICIIMIGLHKGKFFGNC
jgi:hypothetical protein